MLSVSLVSATIRFALATVVVIAVLGALLAIVFSSSADRRAIEVCGVVALVVQCFAFAITRLVPEKQFMQGWLLGAALRFVSLVGVAIVGVKLVGLPPAATLISFVVFLFASTLLEPKLLTQVQ